MRVDLLIDAGDGLVEGVDLLEVKGEQEAVVPGHPAAQRLAQDLGRAPDPPMRQLGKPSRVGLAVDQGLDHRRPLTPVTSEIAESSLMLASSSVRCRR